MGHSQYMKQLLAPLRLYDLDEGIGARELDAVGARLDALAQRLAAMQRESIAATAENEGLEAYEKLLPYIPACGTTEERRRALCALLSIDNASFTGADMARTLAGCGVLAQARETESPDTVEVTFPDRRGEPDGIEALKTRIESILPCHLEVRYVYSYPTWSELEAAFPSWDAIEGMVWAELERVGGSA